VISLIRRRTASLALLVAIAAVALAPGAALADVDVFTRGTVGAHDVDDTPERGGAVCRYSGDGPYHLASVKIRPPDVYAIDATAGRDAGRVGWRAMADSSDPNTGATLVYKSAVVRATAFDDEPALFRPIVASVSGQSTHEYRFFVKMNWYRPNGSLRGTSVHVLTQMRLIYGGMSEMRYGNCPGTLPVSEPV
jgi:hypothetical protein